MEPADYWERDVLKSGRTKSKITEFPKFPQSPADSARAPLSITFLIPTKNGGERLHTLLKQISTLKTPADRILVIANNMTRQSKFALEELSELLAFQVETLDQKFNFSKLINFGANQAATHALLVLNDDVSILDNSLIERTRALLSEAEVGVLGATLSYPDGMIQHAGVSMSSGLVSGHPMRKQILTSDYVARQEHPYMTSAVTFAFAAFLKSDFELLGGLDERLRFGMQDVDFCLRMRAELRKHSICIPTTGVVHLESATRRNPRSLRNLWPVTRDTAIFLFKHGLVPEYFAREGNE
jgi:GT2 family glycosyltransferase